MNPSPQLLRVLRWLGLAEALLAVAVGVFGEEIFYLPPSLRPLLTALVCVGIAFAAYSWFSGRKSLVPVAAAGILGITAANLLVAFCWGERYNATIEADHDAICRLIPGSVKLSRNPDGEWIQWRVNSSGFRGPELETAGRTRVMVCGDSFVNADFSRLEDTLPVQVGDALSQLLGEKVEVINAGVRGYGPDQSLRRMQRELPILRPRLTVLVVFAGNDFGDLLRNRIYSLNTDGELAPSNLVLSRRVMRLLDGPRKRPVLLNVVEYAWQIWRS